MIEINGLTKKYGDRYALDGISFKAQKGEILGLLGANGAGKTTILNIITGFIPKTEGTISLDGVVIDSNSQSTKKRIGYLPEHTPLYANMTVEEFLEFSSDLKGIVKKQKKSGIERVEELVNITSVRHRLIRNLSRGYKQRIGIAQALLGFPEILILDEPTVGLDPLQIIEIRNLVSQLGKEHTVILSSHILSEVSSICDKVVIMNRGKIVAEDTPDNLSSKYNGKNKIRLSVLGPQNDIERVLRRIDGIEAVYPDGTEEKAHFDIDVKKDVEVRVAIFTELAKLNFPILELSIMNHSLEDIFIQLHEPSDQKEVQE